MHLPVSSNNQSHFVIFSLLFNLFVLENSYPGKSFPFPKLQRCPTASGDKTDLPGQAKAFQSCHDIATADNREAFAFGDGTGYCPCPVEGAVSKTPRAVPELFPLQQQLCRK